MTHSPTPAARRVPAFLLPGSGPRVYAGAQQLRDVPQLGRLPSAYREAMAIVARVLPFRVNAHSAVRYGLTGRVA